MPTVLLLDASHQKQTKSHVLSFESPIRSHKPDSVSRFSYSHSGSFLFQANKKPNLVLRRDTWIWYSFVISVPWVSFEQHKESYLFDVVFGDCKNSCGREMHTFFRRGIPHIMQWSHAVKNTCWNTIAMWSCIWHWQQSYKHCSRCELQLWCGEKKTGVNTKKLQSTSKNKEKSWRRHQRKHPFTLHPWPVGASCPHGAIFLLGELTSTTMRSSSGGCVIVAWCKSNKPEELKYFLEMNFKNTFPLCWPVLFCGNDQYITKESSRLELRRIACEHTVTHSSCARMRSEPASVFPLEWGAVS